MSMYSRVLGTNATTQRVKTRTWIAMLWVLLTVTAQASETAPTGVKPDLPANAVSLLELAMKSDLVALIQVRDTDYRYTRSFPSEGSAFLKVLITYKRNKPAGEIIEVYEKGLHPHECYFETPAAIEEGRRYLVFLKLDPQDEEIYRGHAEGCALEVLVRRDRRYALRYPADGIELADKLDDRVTAYDYQDSNALVSEASLTPARRDDLLSSGLIVPYRDGFKYTRGVDLTAVRKLITAAALTPPE